MEAPRHVIRTHEAISLVANAQIHGGYRRPAVIHRQLRTPFTQEITGSNPVGGIYLVFALVVSGAGVGSATTVTTWRGRG
jgi:hypothetical protein